jgi:hypothetical protein
MPPSLPCLALSRVCCDCPGTDIFKALALGAKAVGVGRPALYAMSAYGTEGVKRMVRAAGHAPRVPLRSTLAPSCRSPSCGQIRILKDELEMTMRLMGTPRLADIKPGMVRHSPFPPQAGDASRLPPSPCPRARLVS